MADMTGTLAELTETHTRFEAAAAAIRALNFEAAQVAWKRLDVLLERLTTQALAAVMKA